MDRGTIGLLPRAPCLEDESHLGYYESLRNFAIRELFPAAATKIEAAVAEAGLPDGGRTAPLPKLLEVTSPLPVVGAWKRLMRSQQLRTWQKVRTTLLADEAQHERALQDAEREVPGRLHYDPSFETPEYACLDIHLQPGGYVGDRTVAGHVFHYGTQVFYQGDNDQDELHEDVASRVAEPADGRVQKILDVGCSIGQATTALKTRFPQAQVWGLDVALPLLRYAHLRAVNLGIDVHFKQGLAEDTGFEDGEFDSVLAYILFHEVPEHLFAQIVAEAFRVLRPGGTFTIVDAPNGRAFPAPNRVWLDFDANHNCEPYSPAFVATDLTALLESQGFRITHSGPTPTFLWCTQCEKPVAA
ncbi:MAG: methyltransferase domain-containing protein [Gammaproteobacteria bacterium]|nr:methyltransferase domain-containing protein [Gammaproteobacteria bacterium]